MKELSVFVDESGDFGNNSSYYIVSILLHDQSKTIEKEITKLDAELKLHGFDNIVIHTQPLIRRKESFERMCPNQRRYIFSRLFFFFKSIDIKYKTFFYLKNDFEDLLKLEAKISRDISIFIKSNLEYFQSFDLVRLYYDNGQYQLNRVLNSVLAAEISKFESRKVLPKDYKLFQVADMLCTLQLLKLHYISKELSKSELRIFHSYKDLRKDFLKYFDKKMTNL